jgi:hypothetical protein
MPATRREDFDFEAGE